jgi:hypothetical protein
MKKHITLILILSFGKLIFAQTDPLLYSWIRNLNGAVGYNSIPSNVQSVSYSSTDIYITATCIPGYSIGPWTGNPNTPTNQNFVFKITRTPQQNTGTATATGLGHTGVWSNGVSIFNAKDGMSYNNAGVWNRNAYYWEGGSFDNCLGHPAPNGEYHHHVNPKCLYDATDNTHHSPIIGYSFDGFPIYGAYGYSNGNGSGGIKRMLSSYVLNTSLTRTNGPAVSSTYPLGCFIEDYTYVAGSGDLDNHNGRFCITPEYPAGIYAYFVTIDASLNPVYPFTPGPTYYGIIQTGNTGPSGGHNTIPAGATTYATAFFPTISITTNSTNVCAGATVNFSSSITNGGTSPLYAWKKNGTIISTNSTFSTTTINSGDIITCELTSNANYLTASTATSNSITMTVQSSPTLNSFFPSNGSAGTVVTINGTNFSGITSVTINGIQSNFAVISPTQINATVPVGNTNGIISISGNCGTVNSVASFSLLATDVLLNLKVFIEGIYIGNGQMAGVISSNVCDTIIVQLASATYPYSIVYSDTSTISKTGNGTFTFPYSVYGNSFYIVVRHRNSIQTWSKYPVSFNTINAFDFTVSQ